MPFSLQAGRWYACEFIGDEFAGDRRSYSPILVEEVRPRRSGQGLLDLRFFHANYPTGVQDKEYGLQVIERGETYLLARSLDHTPSRLLLIHDIALDWLRRHFPQYRPDADSLQAWLSRHVR